MKLLAMSGVGEPLNAVSFMDEKEKDGGINEEERTIRIAVKSELMVVPFKEEMNWRRKSCFKWIRTDNRPDSFIKLQTTVTERLYNVLEEGRILKVCKETEWAFPNHFHYLYCKEGSRDAWINEWEGTHLSKVKKELLEKELAEEVKTTVSLA